MARKASELRTAAPTKTDAAIAPKDPAKRRGHNGLGRTQTRVVGKFRSHYTNKRLYEVVAKAAHHVRPNFPKELRQTEFDRARAEIDHADCPSARQIATRLNRSWPDIVSDAVDQHWNQTTRDAVEHREEEADWITEDHLFYALRRAARYLGAEAPTRDQYEAARVELLAVDRGRHKYGGLLEETLPTVSQIERAARNFLQDENLTDWEKALAIAQLKKPTSRKKEAVEMHVAIHHYIQASGGLLPTSEAELDRFRRTAGIAVKRRPKGQAFEEVRKQGVAYAATVGMPTTGELPAPGTKPDFDLTKVPVADLPTAITRLTKDEKLAKIAEYLDYCETLNTQPRQKHYKGLAPTKGWPSDSNLGEDMNWTQWVAAADEWRHMQRKTAA